MLMTWYQALYHLQIEGQYRLEQDKQLLSLASARILEVQRCRFLLLYRVALSQRIILNSIHHRELQAHID